MSIFIYCSMSYLDAVREATLLQIDHFGQTPMQLMSSPHPRRAPQLPIPRPLGYAMRRMMVSGAGATNIKNIVKSSSWIGNHCWLLSCSGRERSGELARAATIFSNGDSGWQPRTPIGGPWHVIIDLGSEVTLNKIRIQSVENCVRTFVLEMLKPGIELQDINEDSWERVASGTARNAKEMQQVISAIRKITIYLRHLL